ncbi:MAG: septal ring lytic transglycosylase RlpA family protein [Myxococcales bacterium]|nr:septal ring lytic transglycosylase RlpA family protein [Myxococcales bacterium]
MTTRCSSAIVFLATALSSCADVRAPRAPSEAEPRTPHTGSRSIERPTSPGAVWQTGRASYYSDKLAGRKTANGERYDPSALTAAHRTLPFGTVVVVRRQDGRSVRVRINDRGPFGDEGRIIDLSRRAAEELGMMKAGVVEVSLSIEGR